MPQTAVRDPYWSEEPDAVLRRLGSGPTGLDAVEAASRLRRDGPNALEDRDRAGPLRLLWRQFESPLVLILVFGALVALVLQEWTEASIILLIVLGSTLLGFTQEYHASRTAEALRKRLALTARVIRDGREQAIPAAEIVAGDVVLLAAGNLTPADGLILEARDFLVTEASLTGESFPVEKRTGTVRAEAGLAERTNSVFAGSSVRSGEARVLVVETGRRTILGATAARLRATAPETEFAHGLRRFGYLLLRVMVVLVAFVLTINQVLGRPFLESFLFSVALAVGMSPELLPAIVSITLSAGARAMAKRGVLVRRLEAIESLGGVEILCTDKTGTLTDGTVGLQGALDVEGRESESVMRLAYLNASLETGIANPLDEAIVAAGATRGVTTGPAQKVDEIPYDFQRKRLTIVVEDGDSATRLVITKGAFDQMIAICASVRRGDADAPLDEATRARLQETYRAFGEGGLRALAIAVKRAPTKADYTREDERDLSFVGFLTFLDPPKKDAKQALDALAAAGVRVKIITGDNRYVAANVAGAMGLNASAVLCGADLEAIKGDALTPIADRTDVFAEVDPQQKERIVLALRRSGRAVAFLGDGINDAPALHAADVGISVEGAVDVAREAADIILLERDLGVLREGIEGGRRTFANTLKYICITTGSSFGNMVSMALATPFLPFLPLTATQVLLTNFLTDLPLLAVTTDAVDPERVQGPQRWRVRDIQTFMLTFGLLSSVFDLLTFAILLLFFRAGEREFQTTWFVVSVLTEIAALLVLRTWRRAWKSRPAAWILRLSVGVVAVVLIAPYLPVVGPALELQPLPTPLLFCAGFVVLAYAAATETVKTFYRRAGRKA